MPHVRVDGAALARLRSPRKRRAQTMTIIDAHQVRRTSATECAVSSPRNAARRRAVVKPAWGADRSGIDSAGRLPSGRADNSNTFGSGVALRGTAIQRGRAERVRAGGSNVFDSAATARAYAPGTLGRVGRRLHRVATSPGGILCAVLSMVLSVGLSPLIVDDAPAPSAVVSSAAR